jgi:hypothetical protein
MHYQMRNISIAAMLTAVLLLTSACNSPGSGNSGGLDEAVQAGVAATLTKEAWLVGVESARQTAIVQESGEENSSNPVVTMPASTQSPDSSSPGPDQGEDPTSTATLPPVSVQHAATPGIQMERANTFVTDFNSSGYANEGYTYGDLYLLNRFERPFTAEEMEYRGELDLILVNWKVTPPWIYAIFFLAEDLPDFGEMNYSIELDLDENGRGDYLIQTGLPTSTEWSTDLVRVYSDENRDVGGSFPLFADNPDLNLDGYETLLFDRGQGEDPDLAWSRRHPDEKNSLQIAFKSDLLGEGGYMWSAWADEGLQDVGLFDYHDQIPFPNAGSPNPDHPYYPLREIALVDSTCRSWYGFTPTGSEPGICLSARSGKNIKGFCPQYSNIRVDCSQVCYLYCPSAADYCIPCTFK